MHIKKKTILITTLFLLKVYIAYSQPNWTSIKSNATFNVADTSYATPYIQPINVGGWEDGLFITRDGKHLFSTYMPIDIFSWLGDWYPCIDFVPYFRPPLLNIDTVTNPMGCSNFIHSDIIIASRTDTSLPFNPWINSNLAISSTFEGGAHGVMLNSDTFDVFVFTRDLGAPQGVDIYFMKNVPINPGTSTAVPILSTPAHEDNPHIERLNDSTLLLFFDRDRYIYYSLSYDNGTNWQTPVQITNVLNDQSPFDVQPHLWNDGSDWWVYFCANSSNGIRGIYKSKQLISGDWNSWGPKELVIEGASITSGAGTIIGIGEPTLTQWGDLSFVVIYGDLTSADTTDVFDCDPWLLPKKGSPLSAAISSTSPEIVISVFPNPTSNKINISLPENQETKIEVFNSIGILVKVISIIGKQQIDVSDLPNGIYFIRPINEKNLTLKFIKQ